MEQHVINTIHGSLYESGIKDDQARMAAASPTRFHGADGKRRVWDS